MKQKRIFIVGCAGSGNTLLRRCFWAFDDVDVLYGGKKQKEDELSLRDFLAVKSGKRFVIGKRVKQTIFSSDKVERSMLDWQADKIRSEKIIIINTIRDGRDVILSTVTRDKIAITPRRWIHCMRHRRMWPKCIDYEVPYETLVRYPDDVQRELMRRYGLKPRRVTMQGMDTYANFSDYPAFLPPKEYDTRQFRANARNPADSRERYRPRPITADKIGKDREAYKRLITDGDLLRDFEKELKRAGYL